HTFARTGQTMSTANGTTGLFRDVELHYGYGNTTEHFNHSRIVSNLESDVVYLMLPVNRTAVSDAARAAFRRDYDDPMRRQVAAAPETKALLKAPPVDVREEAERAARQAKRDLEIARLTLAAAEDGGASQGLAGLQVGLAAARERAELAEQVAARERDLA